MDRGCGAAATATAAWTEAAWTEAAWTEARGCGDGCRTEAGGCILAAIMALSFSPSSSPKAARAAVQDGSFLLLLSSSPLQGLPSFPELSKLVATILLLRPSRTGLSCCCSRPRGSILLLRPSRTGLSCCCGRPGRPGPRLCKACHFSRSSPPRGCSDGWTEARGCRLDRGSGLRRRLQDRGSGLRRRLQDRGPRETPEPLNSLREPSAFTREWPEPS